MRALKTAVAVGVAVASFGCTPEWARENETGIIMEIAEIVGIEGGETGGTEGSILFSDVSSGFNDDARVFVNVYRKNPGVNATSALEHVRLESYQVRYFRTDGRNVEGVDVPHRITGALSAQRFHTPTGTDEVEVEAIVNVVRHVAKIEPPLVHMIGIFPTTTGSFSLGGEGLLTTVAEITVYARQVTTGEPLSASGRFQVVFADFADDPQ